MKAKQKELDDTREAIDHPTTTHRHELVRHELPASAFKIKSSPKLLNLSLFIVRFVLSLAVMFFFFIRSMSSSFCKIMVDNKDFNTRGQLLSMAPQVTEWPVVKRKKTKILSSL